MAIFVGEQHPLVSMLSNAMIPRVLFKLNIKVTLSSFNFGCLDCNCDNHQLSTW